MANNKCHHFIFFTLADLVLRNSVIIVTNMIHMSELPHDPTVLCRVFKHQ